MTTTTARGLRNHNPGNIDFNGTKWQGLADPPSDGRFCRFASAAYGIRALARTLVTYQDKHGINTVEGIIHRWAPPTENDTGAYVAHVAKVLGRRRDEALDLHTYVVMRPLVEAIIAHENGAMPYTDAELDKGLVLAGIEPEPKPLSESRTLQGGQVAAGTTMAGAIATVAEQADALKGALAPLVPYLPWLKFGLAALTLIGVGYMVWARLDDRRRLAR